MGDRKNLMELLILLAVNLRMTMGECIDKNRWSSILQEDVQDLLYLDLRFTLVCSYTNTA